MKVYILIHDYYSHDMFVVASAKQGNPTVAGVFSTRAAAEAGIRPGMDDYVIEREISE